MAYQKQADGYVRHKRAIFEAVQKAEKAKPPAERVPHYLDKDGYPRPYDPEELEKF